MRSCLRWSVRGLAAGLCSMALLVPGGPAHASSLSALSAADTTIPLAAPVSVGAIVLGVLGMTIGVLRQRRRAAAADAVAGDADETSAAPASESDATFTPRAAEAATEYAESVASVGRARTVRTTPTSTLTPRSGDLAELTAPLPTPNATRAPTRRPGEPPAPRAPRD